MLIPREKPYLQGLNSYYLHLDKFVEHMQGDIGSGAVYCRSPRQEMLIYFTESEVISCLIQDMGAKAVLVQSVQDAESAFARANFSIEVFELEDHAIFFWAQMPPFQRAKAALKSTEIPLPDLIFRLRQKLFSGFIDVQLVSKADSGLLFFHEGDRVGGSYTWGRGGMSTSNEDYNLLLSRVQTGEGVFTFGSFLKDEKPNSQSTDDTVPPRESGIPNPMYSELRPALEEFLFFFIQALQRQANIDPQRALKEHILKRCEDFPYLDPLRSLFEYSSGIVKFAANAPVEKITKAVIQCAWEVVNANDAQDSFANELVKMKYRQLLLDHNISITG